MSRKRIGQLGRWLALALLVAQFGAEIHLYSHPLADTSDRLGTTRSCGTCLASAQLQDAVAPPTAENPVRAVAWVTLVAELAAPATSAAPLRAYRSRAPPVLA